MFASPSPSGYLMNAVWMEFVISFSTVSATCCRLLSAKPTTIFASFTATMRSRTMAGGPEPSPRAARDISERRLSISAKSWAGAGGVAHRGERRLDRLAARRGPTCRLKVAPPGAETLASAWGRSTRCRRRNPDDRTHLLDLDEGK